MPKLLIVQSNLTKDRKATTSPQNVKALIEKRLADNAEDKVYTVITIITKLGLKNVVELYSVGESRFHETIPNQLIVLNLR